MSATDAMIGAVPHPGLLRWLVRHGVDYELREHPLTFTARETARVEGVDPRRFAKTLALTTDQGKRVLVVLEAIDHLDLLRANRLFNADVRLLTESELNELCPDCEIGAMPPIGELWDVPVVADFGLRDDEEITFHAGSHAHTVTVDRRAWEHAARVTYGDLAEKTDRPAWADD